MVSTKEIPPDKAAKDRLGLQEIHQFLADGQYEELAALLVQLQILCRQNDDRVLADILTAAYQICSACDQCKAEITWHKNAEEETRQRQQALKNELNNLLNLIFNQVVEKMDRAGVFSGSALTMFVNETNLSELVELEESEPLSILRRLQHLLKLAKIPQLFQASPLSVTSVVESGISAGTPNKLSGRPTLVVYCLGPFRVYQNEQLVKEWRNTKSKSVFKYLVTHRDPPAPKEVLMELFWPDVDPDSARNNLNVAIYGLRQVLRRTSDFPHILFQDDCYLFNPELQIWIDVEEFISRFRVAQTLEQRDQLVKAVREYHAAEALYQGEYLAEDRYEDWLIPQRQSLEDTYLNVLDRLSGYYYDREDYASCINLCHKILEIDVCCEKVHRCLMRCYCRQNQRYLALRQYHQCVEALKNELDISPSLRTLQLYESVRDHKPA